jgi:hypothetical protein
LNYLSGMGLLSKSVIWNPIVSGVIFCKLLGLEKISSILYSGIYMHRFFLYIFIGFDFWFDNNCLTYESAYK